MILEFLFRALPSRHNNIMHQSKLQYVRVQYAYINLITELDTRAVAVIVLSATLCKAYIPSVEKRKTLPRYLPRKTHLPGKSPPKCWMPARIWPVICWQRSSIKECRNNIDKAELIKGSPCISNTLNSPAVAEVRGYHFFRSYFLNIYTYFTSPTTYPRQP